MVEPLGHVALFGLGASTCAAATYLSTAASDRIEALSLYVPDTAQAQDERAQELRALGVRILVGSPSDDEIYDIGILSPGIACTSALYREASLHCIELISEPELAWRESPKDWIGITGTNGKTTTTTLACELIRSTGRSAQACGNIGLPPIACVSARVPEEVFVAELSSFQLESSYTLKPHVAVLLGISEDHVEWHGSFEAYVAAKEHLFARLEKDDLALVGTDESCIRLARRLRGRGVRVVVLGAKPDPNESDAAWVDDAGRLAIRLRGHDEVLCAVDELLIKGAHNIENALAASACALEFCGYHDSIPAALKAFHPLEHRIEFCAEVEGVKYYDDSKGTNVDATLKALDAFEPGKIVVLLGGHDKGSDLGELCEKTLACCKAALVYGEAAGRFYDALTQKAAELHTDCRVVRCQTMRDAFEAARGLACPEEVILLSPACSSYDEFSNYVERGNTFRAWVHELEEAACACRTCSHDKGDA